MDPHEIALKIIRDEIQEALIHGEDAFSLLLEASSTSATARRVMTDYYKELDEAISAMALQHMVDVRDDVDQLEGDPALAPLHKRLTAEINKAFIPFNQLSKRLGNMTRTFEARTQRREEKREKAASLERMRKKGKRIKARGKGLELKWKDPYTKETHKHRAKIRMQQARDKKAQASKKSKKRVAKPYSFWSRKSPTLGKIMKWAKAESIELSDDIILEIAQTPGDLILEKLAQGIPKDALAKAYGDLSNGLATMLKSSEMQKVKEIMLQKPNQYARLIPELPKVIAAEYKKLITPLASLWSRLKAAADKFGGTPEEKPEEKPQEEPSKDTGEDKAKQEPEAASPEAAMAAAYMPEDIAKLISDDPDLDLKRL